MMKRLRKLLELGFSATIISSLLLTACGGGGGGGGSAAATGTSVTVTPVKGKFQGSCMVSVSNTAGTTLFSGLQTISTNGTTLVTLPAGSTGPYIISISGDTGGTCRYFNDNLAAPQLMTLLPTESLNALVMSSDMARASGVAVTSLTEIAYQATSAVNNGNLLGLNDNSLEIYQGIAAAVNLAGLTGASAVSSIFVPPAVLPQSGVLVSDDMGRVLVELANLNALRPMDGVKFASLQAAEAARPASAVQFQSARVFIPIQPVGSGVAFAVQLTSSMQGAASAVINSGNTSQFLNDITAASGLRDVSFGFVTPTVNTPTVATVIHASLSNFTYTVSRSMSSLLNRVWTTPANSGTFVLGAGGWTDGAATAIRFSMNADGTARMTQDGYGTIDYALVRQAMSGVPFFTAVISNMRQGLIGAPGSLDVNAQLVLNASGVPTGANSIPVGSFGAGSVMYKLLPAISGVLNSQAIYQVQTGSAQAVNAPNGTQLAVLPTVNSSFCLNGNSNYVKPGVTSGTFDVFATNGTCTAPLVGVPPAFTVTPVSVTVNGVNFIEVPMLGTTPIVIAQINGLVYAGQKLPAGSPFPLTPGGKKIFNVTAMQQFMQGLNLPAF